MAFHSDFVWGAASSAYQIEGAYNRDGKGPSIWDVFSNTPGKIHNNHTGDTACCHYDHYKEDIKLMSSLGIKAYRFSVSWTRIFPKGDSNLNATGLAFYDHLVDCCLENGITPYMTLFHWDLPQALEDDGGWENRATAYQFESYAAFMSEHFSDRVKHFITINEPQIISYMGYYRGVYAPGKQLSVKGTLQVIHHLALAHGLAVKAIREHAVQDVEIGFASTGELCYPSDDDTANIDTARQMSFATTKLNWGFSHHIYCDMTCLGKYPQIMGTYFETALADEKEFKNKSELCYQDLDFVQNGDIELIHQPIEFLGINVYNGHEVNALGYVPKIPGGPRTAMKWPVTPAVMNWSIRFMYNRYKLPIYITENGLSCNDFVYLDGKVHDPQRIDFLTRYLSELEKACNSGADVRGYFHWSFTDNFEWSCGYDEHFGLIYVDYATQKRIPKDSAYWYQDFIQHANAPAPEITDTAEPAVKKQIVIRIG